MQIVLCERTPISCDSWRTREQILDLHSSEWFDIHRWQERCLCIAHQLLALLHVCVSNVLNVVRQLVSFFFLPSNNQLKSCNLRCLNSDIDSLASVDSTKVKEVIILLVVILKVLWIKVVRNDNIVPVLVAIAYVFESAIGMVNRIAFPDLPSRPVTTSVANPRLNADQIGMSITDRSNSTAPERKDEVMLLLALAHLPNGIGIECLVCVILGVELEERLAPVMTAITLGKVIVCQDADVFRALQVAILMPIVDNLMPSLGHHLPEFDNLLRIGACIKLF